MALSSGPWKVEPCQEGGFTIRDADEGRIGDVWDQDDARTIAVLPDFETLCRAIAADDGSVYQVDAKDILARIDRKEET